MINIRLTVFIRIVLFVKQNQIIVMVVLLSNIIYYYLKMSNDGILQINAEDRNKQLILIVLFIVKGIQSQYQTKVVI